MFLKSVEKDDMWNLKELAASRIDPTQSHLCTNGEKSPGEMALRTAAVGG